MSNSLLGIVKHELHLIQGSQFRYPPEIWVALAALTGVSGFMKAMSDVKTSHNQTDRLIKTRDTTLLLYKRIVITL